MHRGGKQAIQVQRYDDQDDATNAVVLGKADAMSRRLAGDGLRGQAGGGKLQLAGEIYEAAPYGIAVAEGLGARPGAPEAPCSR